MRRAVSRSTSSSGAAPASARELSEAEVEAQLRAWQAEMRALRARRLATTLHVPDVKSSRTPRVPPTTQPTGAPPRSGRDRAVPAESVAAYKKELHALRPPPRHPPRRTLAAATLVKPNEVEFRAARSVLHDYLVGKAAPPPRGGRATVTRGVVTGPTRNARTASTPAAAVRPRQGNSVPAAAPLSRRPVSASRASAPTSARATAATARTTPWHAPTPTSHTNSVEARPRVESVPPQTVASQGPRSFCPRLRYGSAFGASRSAADEPRQQPRSNGESSVVDGEFVPHVWRSRFQDVVASHHTDPAGERASTRSIFARHTPDEPHAASLVTRWQPQALTEAAPLATAPRRWRRDGAGESMHAAGESMTGLLDRLIATRGTFSRARRHQPSPRGDVTSSAASTTADSADAATH